MRTLRRSINDPWVVALAGVFLAAVSVAGVWHSVCAGMAQGYYHRAKYGKPEADTGRVLELCRRAYSWYPHHYYFSILAAEKAYYTAEAQKGQSRKHRMEQAVFWCDRGLAQNWWKGQLRRLKARFLWEESPSKAIRFWEAFVEWQFWEPHHHAVLAEMYARVGDFDKAEGALVWADGTPEWGAARRVVDEEKKEWNAILSGEKQEWGE